jgi:hypothetical protein
MSSVYSAPIPYAPLPFPPPPFPLWKPLIACPPCPNCIACEADLSELFAAIDAFCPPPTSAGMTLTCVVAKLQERQRQRHVRA